MVGVRAMEYDLSGLEDDRSSREVAAEVVDFCLSNDCLAHVAILGSRFLRSWRLNRMLGPDRFRILVDATSVDKAEWVEACSSRGHMSVWFLSSSPADLLSGLRVRLGVGEGRQVLVGSGGDSDPMRSGQRESLEAFMASKERGEWIWAVCLSHDAAQLYEISLD